jgi:L-amino acid N-acyltransferase YncA
MECTLDNMRAQDWDQVRRIFLDGMATGQSSFEVEPPTWERWDQGHHQHSRLVARRGDTLVGWVALAPTSQRRCYAGVAEVSLYVAEGARGQGIGRRLLQTVIESSERHGIWTLVGATFASNEASIKLQTSCGFRIVGRRERIAQRDGVWHDTIITERRSKVVG